MKSRQSSGLTSFMITCSSEPPLFPRDALSRMPVSSCPRSMSTRVSSGHSCPRFHPTSGAPWLFLL